MTTALFRYHREAAINAAAAAYRTLTQQGEDSPDEELYEELCEGFNEGNGQWFRVTALLYPFLVRDHTEGHDEGYATVQIRARSHLTEITIVDDADEAIEPTEHKFIFALLHGETE